MLTAGRAGGGGGSEQLEALNPTALWSGRHRAGRQSGVLEMKVHFNKGHVPKRVPLRGSIRVL